MKRTVGQTVLGITGFIACPCHVPLILPLVLGLVGGTTMGTWLATHTVWIVALSTSYFVVVMSYFAWRFVHPSRPLCPAPITHGSLRVEPGEIEQKGGI